MIEDHVSRPDAAGLSNVVTEVVLAEQAQVQHVRVQRDGVHAAGKQPFYPLGG